MKKASSLLQRGFTLIELLIVIALLGALAVGMIATIDPFEQLKKGQDTAARNMVSELYNSFIRYYGVHTNFPWGTGNTWSNYITLGAAANYIETVATAGELKTTFMEAATGYTNRIFITSPTEESINVCFTPQSKSFQTDPLTQYTKSGVVTTGCSSMTGGSSQCSWCVK